MARRRLILNPFEWLMLGGLFIGLVYGVVTWSSSRTNCSDPPGSLSIRYGGGDTAYLYGLLTSQGACKLRALAREHPEVQNLVLVDVPGTVDLVNTQEATLFIRNQGWNTLVPSNGSIASGGVMLFLGGVERDVAYGGQVGVHAWSQPNPGRLFSSPDDIPENAERAYRKVYRQLGIDPAFYDFQIESAPAEDIHWMTRAELDRWGLI